MNILKISRTIFLLLAGLFFCFESTVHAALLMHLPLDGNLNDISGNGNNGSFQGGSTTPGFSPAVYNQGLNFDGNNDYITVPSFDPGSTFSASLWVNHDNIGALNTFIEHANNGNNRNDFYIGYDNSVNQLTVELEDTNSTEGGACGDPKFCTGIVLNSNRWYHVVVTVTPTTLNVFIDASLAYSITHSTTVNFGNGSWLLGGDTDNNPVTSANNDYLDGRIDEVRIYNHELSQTEISALFGLTGSWNFDDCTIANNATIVDSSGNNINATAFGGVSSTAGKICTAGLFDGSSGYVQIPHNDLLNGSAALTYSAWINPASWSGGIRQIMAKSVHGGGSGRAQMGIFSEGGILKGRAETAGGQREVSIALPSTGSWHHVALVFNGSTLTLYVDGSSSSTTFISSTLNSTTDELDISKRVGTSQYFFDGAIDEVRVFNRALQAEEITAYNANPDPFSRTCPTCGGGTQTIILSTDNTETLGGLSFSNGSLAEYNPLADTSTLYFNENLFSGNEGIDAVHVLSNDIIILSTNGNATLGGLSFGDDDLVAYDPSNNTATLYFDGGTLFSNVDEDIDAVYIRDNGNIILSTTGSATLGGISFSDGSLVEYVPGTNTATLLFNENLFAGGADIDGVHILSNGNILLSTNNTETLGGLSFSDGSIAEYNTGTNTASLYFNENLFSGGADINALSLVTNSPFHHLEFIHDGSAVTCNAETITVKACANLDCSSLVTTPVTADLLPTGWVGGDSKIFTGSEIYNLKHTVAETVTLDTNSVTPTPASANECKNSGGTTISCDIVFNSSGFIFNNETDSTTIIPTQLAGKNSNVGYNAKTLSLQAVRASDSDPSLCLPTFQNKTLNIDFAAECKNPLNCIAGQIFNLTSGAVSGNLTATTNDNGTTGSSSYDTRSVTFDANGKLSLMFNYPEAGLIELHARHNILLADGTTPSGNYMSGSSTFVVRPLGFSIDFSGLRAADFVDDGNLNDSTGTNLSYATDATGSVFTQAGQNFVTTLTAVAWQLADDSNNDGIPDTGANLTDNTPTQNFGNETTAVIPADVTTDRTTPLPNPGILSNNANSVGFTSGVGTKTLSWSEVGILNLTTLLTNYLASGEDINGNAQNIGRFVPDHFDTTVIEGCIVNNNYTYSGQPFSGSAIARNTAGNTTNNYQNTYAFDTTISNAGASTNFTNNVISAIDFSNGIGSRLDVTYTFATKETIPETITLRANDADTGTTAGLIEATTIIRSGRARLENVFGSELTPLTMPLNIEYYSDNTLIADTSDDGFILNTDDSCTTYDATLGALTNYTDNLSSGETTITGASAIAAGLANIIFSAPGTGNEGSVTLLANNISSWLTYNWNIDCDNADADNDITTGVDAGLCGPFGTASFGLYRGDDRIIYWREVF